MSTEARDTRAGRFTAQDREDIRKVLEGFDKGVFQRSTSNDAANSWAIDLLPYLAALARLADGVEYCSLTEQT